MVFVGSVVTFLDLDFFLDDIPHDWAIFSEERLSDDEFQPWTAERFRQFLEEHCGLSQGKKIPGRIVTHHHEVFAFWKELLMASGWLTTPFRVVHVDGLADLGQSPKGWDNLLGNVLQSSWIAGKAQGRRLAPKRQDFSHRYTKAKSLVSLVRWSCGKSVDLGTSPLQMCVVEGLRLRLFLAPLGDTADQARRRDA